MSWHGIKKLAPNNRIFDLFLEGNNVGVYACCVVQIVEVVYKVDLVVRMVGQTMWPYIPPISNDSGKQSSKQEPQIVS